LRPSTDGTNADDSHEHRIDEDLPLRRCFASDVRHHRDADATVVTGLEQRQRPEVRRRPQEDDEELDYALDGRRPVTAGPADHRREGAGGAADDDVLRCRAFEPHRVDDGVEEDGEGEQAGG
jgi:hypothetical protein